MRAPKHLVDLRDGEPAATLLKAARTVSPPRDARARLLAALVSTSALGTSAIAGAGAAGGSGAALTTVSTTITFSKWVAIGALAGGASIAGAEGVAQLTGDDPSMQRMSSVVTPAAVAARAPATAAAPRASPPLLRQAATALSAAGPRRAPAALPTASAQPALTVPSASPTAAFSSHQPAASTLSAEIAALDAARSALRAGDPQAALNHLSRVEGGMLADEATLIRIQALVSSGDVERARQVAATFLSAYPQSPFAGRIRAAVPLK